MDLEKIWQEMKKEYLDQVESVLSDVHKADRRAILRDVEDHLNQRYQDLPQAQRSAREFEQIIADMGPAQDYAELLASKDKSQPADYKPSEGLVFMNRLAVVLYLVVLFCVVGWTVQKGLSVDPHQRQGGLSFVSDPQLVGSWSTVDYVENPQDFIPGRQSWTGGRFYLKKMVFNEDGTTEGPWRWTKDDIYHPGDKSHAKYQITEIKGHPYLFFEWISGDVLIHGQKPAYYVLQKEEGQ